MHLPEPFAPAGREFNSEAKPSASGVDSLPRDTVFRMHLLHAVDAVAEANGFSGVVRVDRGDEVVLANAYGLAHRGYGIPNTVDTRFAIASGTKGLTALAVTSLIEDGSLDLSTTARSVLGQDLPLIDDDVTIEHLLSHRSGIGDYLDEGADHDIADYLMPVPVHELATTEQYLAALDGHATKFPPNERFAYNNGGYVVLALIAERTSGIPFHELVRQRVCEPAGMDDSAFLRSDELPGARSARVSHDRRHLADKRVPPPGAGQRRRRYLLHRCGLQLLLERPLRRSDRVRGLGGRAGAGPQPRAANVEAVRPRLLAR